MSEYEERAKRRRRLEREERRTFLSTSLSPMSKLWASYATVQELEKRVHFFNKEKSSIRRAS